MTPHGLLPSRHCYHPVSGGDTEAAVLAQVADLPVAELRFQEADRLRSHSRGALSSLPLPEGSVLRLVALPAAVSRSDLGTSRCLHVLNSKRRLVEPGPSQLKGRGRGLGRGVAQAGTSFHSTPLASASHVAAWGSEGLEGEGSVYSPGKGDGVLAMPPTVRLSGHRAFYKQLISNREQSLPLLGGREP